MMKDNLQPSVAAEIPFRKNLKDRVLEIEID